MKILFYDAKQYDIESFDREKVNFPEITLEYLETDVNEKTAVLAKGYDAICAFVNASLGQKVLEVLAENGISLLLLRCAGFNNVDVATAERLGITVLRVPGYSPEAVAEHAMALALSVNRRIHKGYSKVRDNNFSLEGLMGVDLYRKTAGIIGTGKIGAAMARICHGFGMQVIAYDKYPNPSLEFVEYRELEEVLRDSDLISLHCPLTVENYHMINSKTISLMKDDVIFINTSRGELVDTDDLIAGIRSHKFHGVGLDVYEEETDNVFENREAEIMETSVTARLLSFPNVIVTSHQAFFTREALSAISRITLENAAAYEAGTVPAGNKVC
jgi:D-lactate dehydrogenase